MVDLDRTKNTITAERMHTIVVNTSPTEAVVAVMVSCKFDFSLLAMVAEPNRLQKILRAIMITVVGVAIVIGRKGVSVSFLTKSSY